MNNLYLVSTFIFLLVGCANQASENSGELQSAEAKSVDYDGLAKELCNCVKPLVDLQKRVLELSEKRDTTAIKALLIEADQIGAAGDQCVDGLEEKYGVVSREDEKALAAFKAACPEYAAIVDID